MSLEKREEKKEWLQKLGRDVFVMAASGLLFFLVTLPFRKLFSLMAVTEVRPASAFPPSLGLMYGVPGALGCALGNLAADILSGYSPLLCLLGLPAQFFYGILPHLLWKKYGEVRLNNVQNILRYIWVVLCNAAVMALILGLIMDQLQISGLFSTTTLLLFLNNFVFSMVLGIPIIVGITLIRIRKEEKGLSLNERFVLIFLLLGVISAGIIGFASYTEASGHVTSALSLWNRVYFYVVVDLLLFYIVTVLFLWYNERVVTVPVEKLTELAQEYIQSEKKREDNEYFEEECQKLSWNRSEPGYLADAFRLLVLDLEQHMEWLTTVTTEKERIGAELSVATQIQADMLPNIFPAFPEREEINIFATMNPAKEVGGDFYDFFMVDDSHLAIVMADVSGKGVPAALFMVIGKTLIKDHTKSGVPLGEVFTEVNNLLCESNKEGLFITAFEGVLDLESGELAYVNAGHEPPYLYRKGEGYQPCEIESNFVLAGMEDMEYEQGVLQLEPGDRIFLFTDGVTEATNPAEKLYGHSRLRQALNENQKEPPKTLLKKVQEDIDWFVDGAPQFDDITMLCAEFACKSLRNL